MQNTQMRETAPELQKKLLDLATGYAVSQCIFTAARLRIADYIQAGTHHCHELAEKTDTRSDALARLLAALASIGLVTESQPLVFELTPLGRCLLEDAPGTLRNAVLLHADQFYAAWGQLAYSLQSGDSAFEFLHGMPPYQYMKDKPALRETFDAAMLEFSAMHDAAILAAYDFSPFHKLVDIGGGTGNLLSTILNQYPAMKGVLFEQPATIENAGPVIEQAGLTGRCELVAGDFFDSVPAGADAYIIKNTLNDWDDEKAADILRRCRQAMPQGSVLLVMQRLDSQDKNLLETQLLNLNKLLMRSSAGGRVRAENELRGIFQIAGFEFAAIIPTATDMMIIEGYPHDK